MFYKNASFWLNNSLTYLPYCTSFSSSRTIRMWKKPTTIICMLYINIFSTSYHHTHSPTAPSYKHSVKKIKIDWLTFWQMHRKQNKLNISNSFCSSFFLSQHEWLLHFYYISNGIGLRRIFPLLFRIRFCFKFLVRFTPTNEIFFISLALNFRVQCWILLVKHIHILVWHFSMINQVN